MGLEIADPIGGLAVAAMIAMQGVRLAKSSAEELLDASDPKLIEDARLFITASKGDVQVHKIRSLKSGSYTLLLVELKAPSGAANLPTWTEMTDRENLLRMELEEWAGSRVEVVTSWKLQ